MWHSFISQVRLASPSPMSAVPVTTNLGMSWHSWWVSAGHRRQAGCYVRPLLCTAEAGDSQHNQTNDPWRLCPSGREKWKETELWPKALGQDFFISSSLLFPLPSNDLAPGEREEEGRNYCTALYKNVTRLRRTEFRHSSVAEILWNSCKLLVI